MVITAGQSLQWVFGEFGITQAIPNPVDDGVVPRFIYTQKRQIFYFHPDHLGSSNYITNLNGNISQHMEYLPFGEMLVEEHKNSNNSPFKFNGKELDEETGNYYYGARYYDPKFSIWLSVDPLAEKFPSWSPYNYTLQNPVRLTDPDGRGPTDWFKYQAKGEKKATWHWQKGQTATYTDVNGNKQTTSNGYEYLAKYSIKGKNSERADYGTLKLYKQQNVVAESDNVFTGGVGGREGAPSGDYMMRLDIRKTSNPAHLIKTQNDGKQPEITYGLEIFPQGGKMIYNGDFYFEGNKPITDAYGNSRIRLNPARTLGNQSRDIGLYLHGKQADKISTHNCVGDKCEAIQNYFINGGGKNYRGKVPFHIQRQ